MIHIGIDPDVDKSGVAIWESQSKKLKLMVPEYFDLLAILDQYIAPVVHIEAAWLHSKSNWHGGQGAAAQRIAKNVGANHMIGKLIEEYCKRNGIEYTLHKPASKKLTAETFEKLTGYKGRTNQEMRDAALLVYGL